MSSDAKKISHLFLCFQSISDFYKSTWTWCFHAKDMNFSFLLGVFHRTSWEQYRHDDISSESRKMIFKRFTISFVSAKCQRSYRILKQYCKEVCWQTFHFTKTNHSYMYSNWNYFFSIPLKNKDNLQLCTTCTSLDNLWFITFFQGKSRENLALISHNSQWDPMVMKLWPWKTSLELKR